ncbi:MAG TPA: hypothetical protein VK950_02965 [Methylophilus sp.]|nr:hypothetical protein [Methylophilus sp.]
MQSQRTEQLLAFAVIAAVFLFGGSLFIAVFNIGAQIASFWFLLFVQIALGALLLALVLSLIGKLVTWTMGRFADIYEKHRALTRELRKRTPWFVVLTLLVAQAVVAIADKSFQGQELPTVAVTLVLILLFFLANELITRDQLPLRATGLLVWFIAVLALPFFVLLDRKFDWQVLYQQALAVPLFYKAFYTLITIVFVLAPLLFVGRRET